jgi:hypothetical protein
MKIISSTIPLGTFGTRDDIAKAVLFVASDDSSYITGTELFVMAASRKSEPHGSSEARTPAKNSATNDT